MAKLPVEKLKGSKSKPVPVRIVSDVAEPSNAIGKEQRNWKAEDALRDIERAEQHKRDAGLMKDVKRLAKDRVDSLKKIC